MLKEQLVSIDLVKGSNNEYIIRDNLGITIGRIFIIEISKMNKYGAFRIKFYKWGECSYRLLKNTLENFIQLLVRRNDLNKINVVAHEDINIPAFTDLGFELEGIISRSIKVDSEYKNEILFGLDFDRIKVTNINRGLHLRGNNIMLSVLTPGDASDMLNYYVKNQTHLSEYEPDRDESFYTLEMQKRNLSESYKQFLSGKNANFGIYKGKRLIGKIQISNIVIGIFKSAFIGYSIDKDEQGKGYMKEALRLVLEYAFDKLELHRVEASTLVDNIRSQRVLKSCGFKELGLNEKYLFINGKWRDHITFYKINPA
ncbi:GNAT family N-acetyltransferase [Clostridium luticellarii]|uniref:Putative ribosomal N-acetyltransferase YdaF n=1 Tax=Clostridium luticellarii TaxID=1691940 RepID=A0A2T0BLZ9_9CLOT|nr:GNAT family protein [Clostridium luticellarii]MCI1945907.1 GNAT family N-acetyltransferase [Clostridium luticellarii]MCI1969269.1 GNAT family N-acetyltransferase [Clostridium luticellarii]MCI1996193.1 GNAT family N-acetyltransferase [Clostridium luticellarii]MCI2040572.1 GNAT family N-acetyltransferase [Clostridium luticellarii]PRR84889.1 putative ribosomal N-acetyltransferase YdaF [Clostridium luticellarii]